jgi:SAM-dependent methyltransferase
MTDVAYDDEFYEDISDGSRRSAAVVVPVVLRLFPGIRSVADFGCGSGTWLAEFLICGVPRVSGLDFGDGTRKYLFIPRETFRVADLSQPVRDVPPHDLVMSVEVAEHLPESSARSFVRSLTSVADLVTFSAATPLQGGHNHLNERWPSYWIRLFRDAGFRCHDVLRPILWNDRRVEWWYRQNLLLFVKDGVVAPALDGMASFGGADLVHPEKLLSVGSGPGAGAAAGSGNRVVREAFDGPQLALARRLAGPRSPLLRAASKGLLNTERAIRRLGYILQGRSKDAFKARWRARLEGRLICRSGLFDRSWYVSTYPDVAASGVEPFQHFLKIGVKERRDPGPLFSTERYLARHPWVAQTGLDPLVHFLEQQKQASR